MRQMRGLLSPQESQRPWDSVNTKSCTHFTELETEAQGRWSSSVQIEARPGTSQVQSWFIS